MWLWQSLITEKASNTVCALIFTGFIFRRFSIFTVFTLLNLQLGTVELKYSRVKYSRIYGVSLYSIWQLQRCKTCWTLFSAAYLAILAFWVTVMVLSYCSLFIYPMATNPLCSAAATHVVLSTSFRTAFVIEGGMIFSKSGTIPSKDE